jgi:hypothetical protein
MTETSPPAPVIRGRTVTSGLVLLAIVLATTACTATMPVRVLPKGESRWAASIGGPLLPHHAPTGFIPYTNVGKMWGHSERTTLTANVHLLAAAFGVAGIDVGAARRLTSQRGAAPELTGLAQLYGFVGPGGARVYPNLTATASWAAGPRTLLYGGAGAAITFDGAQTVIATPHAGVQRDVGRRFVLQLEGKWMAANVDMHSGLFEGENSIGGNGGLALQLGVQVKR